MASQNQSPFAALSFSEQQEQWRIFRAQHLDFQEVSPKEQPSRTEPRQMPAPAPAPPPRHGSLDRVRSQLAAASRRAGAFQPVTSTEK